jgi:poly-gamma-glutamate synthesis protein (capsule biosynthesis protein)
VGGIEVYRGATIVYSLANFCFGGNLNPDDKDTFIFQQTFELREGGPVPVETVVIPAPSPAAKTKTTTSPRF